MQHIQLSYYTFGDGNEGGSHRLPFRFDEANLLPNGSTLTNYALQGEINFWSIVTKGSDKSGKHDIIVK